MSLVIVGFTAQYKALFNGQTFARYFGYLMAKLKACFLIN